MPLHWLACPHCKAPFQVDPAKPPPSLRCPSCQGALRLPFAVPTAAASVRPGWFYAQDKKKFGPIPLEELHRLAIRGQLRAGDMVMREGTDKWLAAGTLAGLFTPPVPTANGPATRTPLPPGWYYAQANKRVGPVTLEQLRLLVNFGMVRPTDMLLPEGTSQWKRADSLVELFPPATVVVPTAAAPVAPTPSSVAPPRENGVATAPTGWYYAQANKRIGPVSREALTRLVASGGLKPSDMLLPEGSPRWVRADSLADLFHTVPPVTAAPAEVANESDDAVFPESRPVPAPLPKPTPPPPAPEEEGSGSDVFFRPPPAASPSILAEDTATPKAPDAGDSFVPDLSHYQDKPPSVVADDVPKASIFDSFIAGVVSDKPIPPAAKPLRRPSSARACPHCGGTAYCGRKWDAAGIMESGPVCSRCKEKSGLAPDGGTGKVVCSYCDGTGCSTTETSVGEWRAEAVAWRLRGLAASDSGDYEQAIADFTEALDLEPDFADAYYDRGWAFLATGRTEEGEADLAEAARLSPKFGGSTTAPAEEPRPGGGLFGWFGRKGK